MHPFHRRLLKVARTTHVYLTLFGLVLILFFALTGFMLNHEDWFGLGEPRTRTAVGSLRPDILRPTVDRLAVVEALRKDYGATGAVDSFRDDEELVEVVFLRPGSRAVAEIHRADGKTAVTIETRGVVGVMTDLHKGKSSGRVWGLLIDAVCVLLLVISATGLVLWSSLKSRGKWGVVAFLAGLVAAAAVYFWAVP